MVCEDRNKIIRNLPLELKEEKIDQIINRILENPYELASIKWLCLNYLQHHFSSKVGFESEGVDKSPIEYSFDFDKFSTDYSGIRNSGTLINDYVQENFDLVEWNQLTSTLGDTTSEKTTWIVTEGGVPIGLIPFNKVQDLRKLENIMVYEVCFPIHYTFKLDQTLKEAWGVFSATGDSILPVMGQDRKIVGTLSIFSVPKPEKEQTETKDVIIDNKMEKMGNFLTEKLMDKRKKND